MDSEFDVEYTMNLTDKLKEEHLFMNTEKSLLNNTFRDLESTANDLRSISWITNQQKLNLKYLIRNEKTALDCIKYSNSLEDASFVDGYKALNYSELRITDFIRGVYASPSLTAECLVALEQRGLHYVSPLVKIVHNCLYDYSVQPANEHLVLRVLHCLVAARSHAADTRRHLRRATSSLPLLFRMYCDASLASRLYLTEALRRPLLLVVREDEWFYDVDADRALHRFTGDQYRQRFGVKGTEDHATAVARYRAAIVDKLVSFTRLFVESMRAAMPAFPRQLRHLVAAIYRRLAVDDEAEARAACSDLVFTMYVFPAICDPAPHHILADIPISYTANHNLMQISQIIQNLAVGVDSKDDLYSKFEPDYMAFMMNSLLSSPAPEPEISPQNTKEEQFYNHVVLMTKKEIADLIICLREAHKHLADGSVSIAASSSSASSSSSSSSFSSSSPPSAAEKVAALLQPVNSPKDLLTSLTPDPARESTPKPIAPPSSSSSSTNSLANMDASTTQQSSTSANSSSSSAKKTSPGTSKHNSADLDIGVKVQDVVMITIERSASCPGMMAEFKIIDSDMVGCSTCSTTSSSASHCDPCTDSTSAAGGTGGCSGGGGLGSSGGGAGGSRGGGSSGGAPSTSTACLASTDNNGCCSDTRVSDVIAAIGPSGSGAEVQVSSLDDYNTTESTSNAPAIPADANGKRTRFSLSADQLSNACSENLSTLSDVAPSANGSENDDFDNRRTPSNLSDVVSTMTTGDQQVNQIEERRNIPNLPITIRKKNLEDVTDRFGKFDIKQDLDRFDIKSTVSDTWSTDVLASDSETTDQNQLERLDEVNEPSYTAPVVEVSIAADKTDTASEAWSTDVLGTSDTSELQIDRLLELDYQDDVISRNIQENITDSGLSASTDTRHSSYVDSHDSEDSKSDSSYTNSLQNVSSEVSQKEIEDDAFGTLKASTSSYKEKKDVKKLVNLEDIKIFDPLQNTKSSDTVIQRGNRPKVSFRPISDQNPTHQPINELMNGSSNEEPSFTSQVSGDFSDKQKKHSSFFKSFKDRLTSKSTKRKTRYEKELADGDAKLIDFSSPNITDASESIFEKYRMTSKSLPTQEEQLRRSSRGVNVPEQNMIYDAADLENCKAFKNAKLKLRAVFSTMFVPHQICKGNNDKVALKTILRLMLAEVTLLQDQKSITKLHETLRCLKLFSNNEIMRILQSMDNDLGNRKCYHDYLLKSRRLLLMRQSQISATLQRVKSERKIFQDYLVFVFVKIFLAKMEKSVCQFQVAFKSLTVSDEKIVMVENFLSFLYREMLTDTICKELSEDKMESSKVVIERLVMGTIYHQAMFPNQEADKDRDTILEKHIDKLKLIVTPQHKSLRIKNEYLLECPWPSAQDYISMLAVFRTPTDKLNCIIHCIETILNLLTLANPDSTPASADDIMPILIYVIIQANPPSLLSTMQYVTDFSRKLTIDQNGEACYCWTQFCSAVEYIKTID